MPTVNRKASGSHTQSVLFSTEFYTKKQAQEWLKKDDHGYKTDGYEKTEKYHRFRQYDPEPSKFRYRNSVIKKQKGKTAIILVLGFPKKSKKQKSSYNCST